MKNLATKIFLQNGFRLILLSTLLISQFTPIFSTANPCTSKEKCSECIQIPSCAWCFDPIFRQPRCFQPGLRYLGENKCPEEFVLFPTNELHILSNLELTNPHKNNYNVAKQVSAQESKGNADGIGDSTNHRIVHVKPQRVHLKLRPGEVYSVMMKYTQAEDYPMDLYYLMGASKSVSDDKEKLINFGNSLKNTITDLTSNFRLGFGSFVDKVSRSNVSNIHDTSSHHCEGCAASYGYKHALRLSTDTEVFSKLVKQASVSGVSGEPKGALDAIMQAIECRDIGWRDVARRLLVVSTDASFQSAGDGKVNGIVTPNDGHCHLSQEGFYTHSSVQDYPSIEQINSAVKRNAVNIIFAATIRTIDTYTQLAKYIEGSSVGILESDSSNIDSLIREHYNRISSNVEIKDNATRDVNINLFSRCLNPAGRLINTNKCGNIKVGDVVTFQIDIEVPKCPKNRADHFQTVQIYPVGINDGLFIDIEMLCECNCDKPGDKLYKENAPDCSGKGTYKCGNCECQPGYFGSHCECVSDSLTNTTVNDCNPSHVPNAPVCSNRGQCVCNQCMCEQRVNENERISGKYCECDNFSCDRHNGKLCSGPDHGRCECGVCQCKNGWTGPNCACPISNASCTAPRIPGGKICSGHGTCECGVCRCDVNEEYPYSGKFCEICKTCSDRCPEFKDCVQCQLHKMGIYKKPEDCLAQCTKFVPTTVDKVVVDENNNEVFCSHYDEDNCNFYFVYYFDKDDQIQIRAQKNRFCPGKDNFSDIDFQDL